MNIEFPDNFPTKDTMFDILHKIIEKSWKNDISASDINEWLSNFSGKVFDVDSEQRLALWLLCNFTFYSSEDINHLCKVLFRKFIHDLISRDNIEINQIEEVLKQVCFSSVGSASESGGLLLYHFRQEANLSLDRFFYPTSIESTTDTTIVLIDDATLSGGTALRSFYKRLEDLPHKHIYYLTIIASEEAIEKLKEKGIIVICCSIVDERNKCFSENSMAFYRYPSLKNFAKQLAEKYGEDIVESPDKPLGYKNGEYCFGFYYNTPNNSLPIFWSHKNWTPIFPRKEKLQNARKFHFTPSKYI